MPDDESGQPRSRSPRDFGAGRGINPAAEQSSDPYDVPEWVSEFRRLYVEPKTRAALRDEASRWHRHRPGGGPSRPEGADATPPALTDAELADLPLSDEPLRSRSEVHRDRQPVPSDRPAPVDRPARRADPEPAARPEVGDIAPSSSRAGRRAAREARARAERRVRLRRTVVLGVLLVVVVAIVTWLVARNREPVSASVSAVALLSRAVVATAEPAATVAAGSAAAAAAAAGAAAGAGGSKPRALPGPGVSARPSVSLSAGPRATATPTPTPSPTSAGTGRLAWVDWGEVAGARTSGGPAVRVALEIEEGLGLDVAATARTISGILVDDRGWQTVRDVRFVFVTPAQAARGAVDTRIAVASRRTTERLCGPVPTQGFTSCYNGRVVINLDRWVLGVDAYAGHLEDYRTYLVNHEVGHSFGLGHAGCPASGAAAPVMVPQTLHLWGCRPNPYPALDT